ncbi:MAG: hypothetical protein ACPGYY_10320 [Bacteroidia bacterium]
MEILKELNRQVNHYYDGEGVELVEGLKFSQWETIRTIEFYSNDKYLNGQTDEFGREKPFYNINRFRVNVAVRATDFDTKDIQIVADEQQDYDRSFLLRHEVRKWMKEAKLAKKLNKMGHTRAKYGGVLVKWIEKDGALDVCQWKNLVTDQVDIDNGVIIEKHYLSPKDIAAKRGIWNKLDKQFQGVIELFEEQTNEDYSEDKICVYEVEGLFPETYINEKGDEYKYTLQLHYIAGEDEGKQYILHSEEIKKTRYKYLPYEHQDGRALGKGIVEDGFEAQVWTNDIVLAQRDMMLLATKIGFKTDSNTLENNVLTDLDNGYIIHLEEGRDFSQVNTVPTSLPALQEQRDMWDNQYERISSTFDAVTGETMPSGTPFRQVAILNQEGTSLFAYRREEMGIFIEEIFNDWVIPHLAKKINREHILAEEFEVEDLKRIDERFSRRRANQKVIDQMLAAFSSNGSGKIATSEDYESAIEFHKNFASQTGDNRFLEVPKDYYKEVKAKVSVITTGEQINKAAVFESISNMLNIVSSTYDPNTGQFTILQDPVMSRLFSKAVELSGIGISPIQLEQTNSQPMMAGGQILESNVLNQLANEEVVEPAV